MSRWWRAYDDAVNNPKLQRLPASLFKAWFNLCCLTSKNNGELPTIKDVAFSLRISEQKAAEIISELLEAKMLDQDGDTIKPHDWQHYQYQSDSSAERTRRYRKKQRDGACDVTVTPQNRAETEQIQSRAETEAKPPAKPAKVKLDRRAPKVVLPYAEMPAAFKTYAESQGVNGAAILREWQKFKDHAEREDRRCAGERGWLAAWRGWIGNAIEWHPEIKTAPAQGTAESLQRVWAACLSARRDGKPWPSQNVRLEDIPPEFVAHFERTNPHPERQQG